MSKPTMIAAIFKRWKQKLKKVEEYIKKEGKLPSNGSKDKAVRTLGSFISQQKENYKKKKEAMKEGDPRREMWEAFMEKYPHLFLSEEEKFRARLTELEEYIMREGKRPSCSSKDKAVKSLGQFIGEQKVIYKKKKHAMKEGKPQRKLWEAFMERYPQYFLSDEEEYMSKLAELEEYIKKEGKRSVESSKDKAVRISWCVHLQLRKRITRRRRTPCPKGIHGGRCGRRSWRGTLNTSSLTKRSTGRS